MTIIYTVLSITILYFLFAFGGETIKRIVGRKVCAICAAVSLTWISLLILKLLGFNIDILIIAILMGQSVVGLMSELEKIFKKKELKKFWLVRVLIIAGGTLFVYWLLKRQYSWLLPLVILGFFSTPVVLTITTPKESGDKKHKKAVSKLEEMMENCC